MTTSNSTYFKNNVPTAIVVFGGTGDLAQTKLFPALLNLFVKQLLPKQFTVIGLSRKNFSDADYRQFVLVSLAEKVTSLSEEQIDDFLRRFQYVSGSFVETDAYEKVKKVLQDYDQKLGQCTSKLFYLAVPPEHYDVIFEQLHTSQVMNLCNSVDSWTRLLVEKPFGKDLKTARELEKKLCALFNDDQIYRIDHYLAKNAIENIASLRFANTIISDSWRKEQIESISVRLLETKDVANRGAFYDGIGTLRDVGQNHVLQIYALLTMMAVDVRDAEAIRQSRAESLQDLSEQKLDTIVRGQYEGFTSENGVAEDSETETYFKVSFVSESKDWSGVRFELEAGKALDRNVNEAVVVFRPDKKCHCAFSKNEHEHHNVLKIKFSPEQEIRLSFWVKKPGFEFELEEKEFLLVSDSGNVVGSPEAYERVLFDCIVGDQSRFVSGAEVEYSWRFITPILEKFSQIPLGVYKVGDSGPSF